MTNPVQEVQSLGQSIWYDNIRRGLLTSGELQQLIGLGVTGVTSNPTIFEKAIAGSTDYDSAILDLAGQGKSTLEIHERLVLDDIRAAADLLLPVYLRTKGVDGYVSLEVSPRLAHDAQGTVAEARRLFEAAARPNVMVKVPATPQGVDAVRQLIGWGINVNVTLIFSLDVYRQVAQAYIRGLDDLAESGGDIGQVASVASFFVSRVDTAVDGLLEAKIQRGQDRSKGLLGKAAVANVKLAYQDFKMIFGPGASGGARFSHLRDKGARPQRPLWASTGTKNPDYSDVLYVQGLVGPQTVNTVPQATLDAFLDHGRARLTLEQPAGEETTIKDLADAGIDLEQVTGQLLADGLKAFSGSFDALLRNLEEKRQRLSEKTAVQFRESLESQFPEVRSALDEVEQRDMVRRMWRKDHTLWKRDPAEISDRLGWLTVSEHMCEQAPMLEAFAREIKDAGYKHVVLLGMGGSSLGPEVLGQSFQNQSVGRGESGFPPLIILDSTVPARVRTVAAEIDPAKTLFLVSSKSGGTVEPLSFYRYFRGLADQALGHDAAGRNFVAITDAGTSLEALGKKEGFRRAFLNPSDLGGRYSVLSYFGLVPAALIGIDISKLLDRADCLSAGCPSCVPTGQNPGAWLGAAMGAFAQTGRDKLTLVTSPSIASFGLWVEQLIAESLGKEGKGLIPVAGEPLVQPDQYGQDRWFVYLRSQDDDNEPSDDAISKIQAAGNPVVRLDLRDPYDLGAEFFRWEFATAVAGALLGVNPFDQPDVQGSKDNTDQVLDVYRREGRLPDTAEDGALSGLMALAQPGDYLCIMSYIEQTRDSDALLSRLRRRVLEQKGIATTLGYGPRFLHSTGQLHKGGPPSGLYLQFTSGEGPDMEIPGKSYTFGVLAGAQSLGDLGALQSLGRRVIRVNLDGDPVASLNQVLKSLD